MAVEKAEVGMQSASTRRVCCTPKLSYSSRFNAAIWLLRGIHPVVLRILCSRPSHDSEESGPGRLETGGKNLSILLPGTAGVVHGCCDPPKKHFAMNTYGSSRFRNHSFLPSQAYFPQPQEPSSQGPKLSRQIENHKSVFAHRPAYRPAYRPGLREM